MGTTDRLDRYPFECIVIAVAATLATHVDHLPPWLSIGLAAILALRTFQRRRGAASAAAWLRILLTVLLLALVATRYGNLFGRIPGTTLACGLLGLKLLETERLRDARVVLGFSVFVLMSSLLFTQSLPFSGLVIVVLTVNLAAMFALQPAPLERPSLRGDLRSAATLLIVGIPFAIAAFVLLPRLGTPLWGSRGDDTFASTGMSDSMAPGQFARLVMDESPAFRAEFGEARPPTQALYFRTIVLGDFDGTTWTRRSSGNGNAESTPTLPERATVYEYSTMLESGGDQRWLPALDLPLEAPEGTRLSRERTLVAASRTAPPRQYRLRASPQAIANAALDPAERTRLLALPAGFGPQARALAKGWRNRLHEDGRIVQAALELFHANFDYTLEPPPLARDSVDDFLFGTKAGFCEHYASAFTFLMRAAGIPARVVTGYQGGWWSGSYLLVRQSDAHAWTEVWIDGRGWRRVDPTAAVSPDRVDYGAAQANPNAGAAWLRKLRNRLDVVDRLWNQTIVRFDSLRQHALLTEFGASTFGHGDLLLTLSGVLAFVLLLATLWAMREPRRVRGDALDRAWARFRRRLLRAGIADHPAEGPLDLRTRLHAARADRAEAFDPLIEEYVALRYGCVDPAPERIVSLTRRLRTFRLGARR